MKTIPEIFDSTFCFIFGHDWADERVGVHDTWCKNCGKRKS